MEQTEQAERDAILARYYAATGLDFARLRTWFTCESRPNVADTACRVRPDSYAKAQLIACGHCGGVHPLDRDYAADETYWTTQRQFDALQSYVKRWNRQHRDVHIDLMDEVDVRTDILFRGAKTEYRGYSRQELLTWYSCERKILHTSVASAEAHVARLLTVFPENDPCQVYQCPGTDHYHVGHPRTHVNSKQFAHAQKRLGRKLDAEAARLRRAGRHDAARS